MIHSITVGLQQKIGQPNFGSIGASCNIEVRLDDDEAQLPEIVSAKVKQAFAQCRDCIAKELSQHVTAHASDAPMHEKTAEPNRNSERNGSANRGQRTATEAQVRAIRAIAGKAGLSLASELEQGFGVRNPNQLTIAQASQLIDSLKRGLTPSPV